MAAFISLLCTAPHTGQVHSLILKSFIASLSPLIMNLLSFSDINNSDNKVFFAGVKEENDKFYTNGGRVLNVVSIQDSLEKAIEAAYKNIKEISFKDSYCRKDIGTLYVPVKD